MDAIRSGWGQLAAGLDQSTASQFQMWQTIYYGSIVVLILGGLLFIAGIVRQAQTK
jgi:hypothetical protein